MGKLNYAGYGVDGILEFRKIGVGDDFRTEYGSIYNLSRIIWLSAYWKNSNLKPFENLFNKKGSFRIQDSQMCNSKIEKIASHIVLRNWTASSTLIVV